MLRGELRMRLYIITVRCDMTVKTLYRYKRDDGGITVSPEKPTCEHTTACRIIADKGKVLVYGGEARGYVVDTDTTEGWSEEEDKEGVYGIQIAQ